MDDDKTSQEQYMLSNAEIKNLLDQSMVHFENWRVKMESDPNPKMVHSLANILSVVDAISTMSDKKLRYSYKQLAQHMAILISEVAKLNIIISEALKEDDFIDEQEEEKITGGLMKVVQSSVELIRIVQQNFGRNKQIEFKLPEDAL
jgi:hypothetical protein